MDGVVSLMPRPEDHSAGGAAAAAVRPQGYVLALPRPSGLAGDGDQAVLRDQAADSDDEDEASSCECHCARCRGEAGSEEESGDEDEGDGEEFYDSEDGSYYSYYQERDAEVDVPLKIDGGDEAAEASGVGGGSIAPLVRNRVVVPEGRFLGPAPCFASAGSTAGFMRVAAVEPAAGGQEGGGDKQILVLYRYTHFWAASDGGGGGVEVCGSTKLHQLRFAVPPAADAASSLPFAGSSLAPLIYPARQSNELQALWSRLVSEVAVPPGATRVQVLVDVGILRREDRTRRRMRAVRAALEDIIEHPWLGYHVAMELQLPEPVDLCAEEAEAADGEEDTGCERPAKRRKVASEAAGQECSVCFDLLESDLAVWPGCSLPHVFHGACLELTLKGSEMCPICRRKLSALDGER